MSSYTIRYNTAAIVDAEEAAHYYDNASAGLGERFMQEVLTGIDSIAANPFHAAVRYQNIRCAVVQTFPYLIHYTVDEKRQEIFIEAICNTWQKPRWEA